MLPLPTSPPSLPEESPSLMEGRGRNDASSSITPCAPFLRFQRPGLKSIVGFSEVRADDAGPKGDGVLKALDSTARATCSLYESRLELKFEALNVLFQSIRVPGVAPYSMDALSLCPRASETEELTKP